MTLAGIILSSHTCELGGTDLKRKSGFDLLCQCLRYGAIKIAEDFHRQLGLDATVVDQVIDRVYQGFADAEENSSAFI